MKDHIPIYVPTSEKLLLIIQKATIDVVQLNTAKRKLEKDVNFQLHHRLSNFEVSVDVNLKHVSKFFGLYNTCFLI